MQLPGFDSLVADMDERLLNSESGFGSRIQLFDVDEVAQDIDGDVIGDVDVGRLASVGKDGGLRVQGEFKVEVSNQDVPDNWQDYTVCLELDGPVYDIASVTPIDRSLSVLVLSPHKDGGPSNGTTWLRDDP